ncbi:RrF2 family transcriptional regulator [Oceanibacterium hippocampi]|uniref:HTH-type transcriptional regulator IscR n=1 Tax=Oceanibacterium hippocampi TaxID=745714 RepID=A0A1Y5RSQ8_9PROT|nr:Rrf2 family transcriptional regulator [Oceanibacterium hippocampi]SLN21802.1 HTH-type transcriptional regulator IscR [Oceanibacterium hippocampi]
MLKLPKKTLFALEAVVDIAYNARPEPVQSKEITRRQGIPQRYLEQVMQQLVRAGILKGVRGPRGGYTLARERRRISVGEILRVVDGFAEDEADAREPLGSAIGREVVYPLWDELRADLVRRLDEVTLEELCRRAGKVGIRAENRNKLDFTI